MGLFITFEGIEGCGKTTQARLLFEHLEKDGLKALFLREPGGTALGDRLRQLLLTSDAAPIAPWAELFMYEAARAELVAEVIKPGLEKNQIIICDRFTDSTTAYQGYGRGLDPATVASMNGLAAAGVIPNVTFIIDCPVETGLSRAMERINGQTVSKEDRFEREALEFHEKVRAGYLKIAGESRHRVKVINGEREIPLIHKDICDIIKKILLRYYEP
ncbi:MAG: dTMP kinase [Deltaproteobacteria bacterium]|nr:dTMP kinase [Deltaproteobacteria bacterium]